MTDYKTDVHGHEYAKLSQLKAGDFVVVDDGFDCMSAWQAFGVLEDEGGLYLPCADGGHYLDGQLDTDNDTLVGIYRRPTRPATAPADGDKGDAS